ncbi:uncharacterized protein LOC107272634 isoform X1 [Cephus cinctus]|uniref:Uncharacterized protein LOC107272634 isoform X1 n=1 Tax=Cephus cinctus TaxID=211228 RepID=A0AAJ7C9Y9_CEPCN|nr:uncharacterized protein LOC107272634 isoform X1 [Cephus cinctus]
MIKESINNELSSNTSLEEPCYSMNMTLKDFEQDYSNDRGTSNVSKLSLIRNEISRICTSYLNWGILLSFGIGLWASLCIADTIQTSSFTNKERWIADVIGTKKITANAETVKSQPSRVWWLFYLWNYIWKFIVSSRIFEILLLVMLVTLAFYVERYFQKKFGYSKSAYAHYFYDFLRLSTEPIRSEDDGPIIHIMEEDILQNDKKDMDLIGRFTRKINMIYKCSWKREIFSNLWQVIQRVTYRDLSIERSMISINDQCLSWNSDFNNLKSMNVIESDNSSEDECHLPNSCDSEIEFISERSSNSIWRQFNNDNFHVSQNDFHVSEKLFFNSEYLSSYRTEDTVNTFDLEIEKYLKNQSIFSTGTFQRLGRNDGGSKDLCAKNINSNDHTVNGGMVTSSPAFRNFLFNLEHDQMSYPYT